ncbi:Ribonuclease 3 [Madurella mycetomatis]|uniref:Ribonuclease 3 n=1 Tax=Madurella mycetomatis TaxID=100816 RepID=A0A175VMP6_9PEZI|nr:Ribonuclease 3 [Madurella mycetomatis]
MSGLLPPLQAPPRNYRFSTPTLLDEATIAAGVPADSQHINAGTQGNKTLALIGDALIRLDVAVKSRVAESGTGRATEVLCEIGSNRSLQDIGRQVGLDEFVIRDPTNDGPVSLSQLATTVEALIGAVWIDSGYDFAQAQRVIQALRISRSL